MHHRSQLDTEIFNDGTKDGDVLNSGCGADFVKVNLYIQKNPDIKTYVEVLLVLLEYFIFWTFSNYFIRYNKNARAIWKTWKTELDVYP